jgi:hypothetical protein
VVSLLNVLVALFVFIENSQLVATLAISGLGSSSQQINGSLGVLRKAKPKMVENSHPMNAYLATLLSAHQVVLGSLGLCPVLLVLDLVELS